MQQSGTTPGRDKGIMEFINKDEGGVHQRLILGFTVGGHY